MSLRLKMILGIAAILCLLISAFALLAWRSQRHHRLNLARNEAEIIAAVAERALDRAMGRGETEVVQAILTRIGEHRLLAGIWIVDPGGQVIRSNRLHEVGRRLPAEQRPRGDAPEPVWDLREGTVAVFRPIRNRPSCTACHPRQLEILGFLTPRVSVPVAGGDVGGEWRLVIGAGVAGLVLAGGLIWLLFTLVVARRLGTLAHVMGRVEAGDLAARVVETSRDELGRVAASFNAMVARLAEARRRLEDRHAEEIRRAENLASLGKMAAGIAHEINNPLAGMQNCVRTLQKGAKSEEQRVEYLEMLRAGLERIGRTVGQLLNFGRTSTLKLVETPLPPLLQRCLGLVEHELTARRIASSLTCNPGLPALRADPYQLEQVFLNLLKNALEAMSEGGQLSIQAASVQGTGGTVAEVAIVDTGAGIPPEHLPRIFDPFFTTKEVGRGTGLGLSVSYGIVRAHGGSIDVRSAVGKGTTVTVTLPLAGERGDHAASRAARGG